MKKFIHSNAFLILFCIAFWMLMFFAIPSEGRTKPKAYKGHNRIEAKYSNRQAQNRAYQYEVQSKHPQTHKVWKPSK